MSDNSLKVSEMENATLENVEKQFSSEEEGKFSFNADESSQVIRACLERVLADECYDPERVESLVDSMNEKILAALLVQQRPIKYVVNTSIIQKRGAGVAQNAAVFYNPDTDGCAIVKWTNQSMNVVVTLFGISVK